MVNDTFFSVMMSVFMLSVFHYIECLMLSAIIRTVMVISWAYAIFISI
jgi:hypothetical protein